MSSSTPKYIIPFASTIDAVATLPSTMANQAARLDLLLGEAGSFSATGTSGSSAISFARSYPGNPAATVPGIFIVNYQVTLASTVTITWWVGSWTGVAGAITGATISWQASSALAARIFAWRFFPVL